jgi:hypothetical protein
MPWTRIVDWRDGTSALLIVPISGAIKRLIVVEAAGTPLLWT